MARVSTAGDKECLWDSGTVVADRLTPSQGASSKDRDFRRIEQRPVPDTPTRLSALTITIDPPAVVPPAADARTIALLRKAHALGVTTFDVAEARFPERAERLIAMAFPEPRTGVSVIAGRSFETLARERKPPGEGTDSPDLASAITESLERSLQRLAPVRISIVEWTADAGSASETSSGDAKLPGMRLPGPAPLWAVRLPTSPAVLPTTSPPVGLFSGELSLLRTDLIPRFEGEAEKKRLRLIARDPFSSGRLDGTRFARSGTFGGPGTAPVDLRRLHEEFDPILRLGFLTDRHRRTLAQAALQFVLRMPWVVTAVVPLPDPERFDEVLGFSSCPALTPEDLSRLDLIK